MICHLKCRLVIKGRFSHGGTIRDCPNKLVTYQMFPDETENFKMIYPLTKFPSILTFKKCPPPKDNLIQNKINFLSRV